MTAPEHLVVLTSQASLLDAMEAMERRQVQQVPVLHDTLTSPHLLDRHGIIGILSRREIRDYIGNRNKLRLEPS